MTKNLLVCYNETKNQQLFFYLQSIHEFRVLPIRQIQELLVLQLDVTRCRTHGRLLLVLPLRVPVDEVAVDEAHPVASDDCNLSRHILGRILCLESLRSCF